MLIPGRRVVIGARTQKSCMVPPGKIPGGHEEVEPHPGGASGQGLARIRANLQDSWLFGAEKRAREILQKILLLMVDCVDEEVEY